jgi:acetyl-CoA acyltransferase
MASLAPAFRPDGVVTAGNASQITDGSAALLIMGSDTAAGLGLTPIAAIDTVAVVGSEPMPMLTGPIPATEKLLARKGIGIDDIGTFEVNEAFASVVLAWLKETGAKPERVNPNGGAIALGHPLGGSGARLMTTMVSDMRERGLQYGVQVMCEGGGQANATLIRLL